MNNLTKITFIASFLSSVIAYSLHPYLWEDAWFHLISFSLMGYTRAVYNLSVGTWSLVSFIVWLTCVNSFIDEVFFNPELMQYNEYISFILIILISIKYRDKWTR